MSKALRDRILAFLDQHSKTGSGTYVGDAVLSQALAAPINEVRRQLDVLESEGLTHTANSHDGRRARISPHGIRAAEKLQEAADDEAEEEGGGHRDALTGLLDRGAFDTAFESTLEQAMRQQEPLALVMVDVDHFKKVNDTHGHPAGDDVLREVAARLSRTIRGKGAAYRYGGEEMALLLPNHSVAEAIAVAERARRALDDAKVGAIHVTASFGIACAPEHSSEARALLKMADAALYDAKNRGRNLVRFSGEPAPTQTAAREPERRQPEAGRLTGEQKQKMREDYFIRRRSPVCPSDGALLEIRDTTTMGTVGRSFMVTCPMCGLNEDIQGGGR
jgi:diguanylate cyclase (GGDEF)-like protein